MYSCDDCQAQFLEARDQIIQEGEHFGQPFKEQGKVCPYCGAEAYTDDQDKH